MDEQMLLREFELLANAANAVPKLREMILNLAVRGRLVPQDPTDEPASELLKKFDRERQDLGEKGGSSKRLGQNGQRVPHPYDVPSSWSWTRLAEVCHDWGQTKPNGRFTYLDVSSIDNELGRIAQLQILEAAEAPSRARKLVRQGSVIYSTVRPYLLNVAVVEQEFEPRPIASTAFAVMHPYEGLDAKYLFHFLRSGPMVRFVESQMVGMAYPAISDSRLLPAPFPLPPLPEQRRIVAKVDELMRLCDELESRQEKRKSVRVSLNTSALDALQKAGREALPNRWQFVRDHFDLLYQDPQNVQKLKDTILQLAVQGKLTRQDLSDEPASELLKRIEAEKQRLYEEGKIRKPKKLPPVKEEEKPFEVPNGWEWVRFAAVSDFENGDRSKRYPKRSEYVTSGVPWINTGHIDARGSLSRNNMHYITEEKFESLGGGKIRQGDLLYCLRGATFGKTAFVEPFERGAIASSLMIIRPSSQMDRRFIYTYLTSPLGRQQLHRFDNGTAQPNLSSASVMKYVIPLPPLSEQGRIVARLDELMRLCDELEEGLTRSETKAEKVLEAVVRETIHSKQVSPEAA